jgi:hypothetical protein
MKCPYHGTNYKPKVCHSCAQIPEANKLALTDSLTGQVERVVETCRHTGREKISFRHTNETRRHSSR